MIVTACLCFYDEDIEALRRSITSCSIICNRLVAVDGAYKLVDNGRLSSPQNQIDFIFELGEELGIEVEVKRPKSPWEGQVAKRNFMMQEAAKGSDWLLVVDADYKISGSGPTVLKELARSRADALEVKFVTPNPPKGFNGTVPHEWHESTTGTVHWYPMIIRALSGFRVEHRHWYYSALKYKERVALWGCTGMKYAPADVKRLKANFQIEHRWFDRSERTLLRNKEYTEKRDKEVVQTGRET